jgi:hypothetical protein
MCGTCEPLPSPLMGEGLGGGEDSPSSPHPHLPPPRGEGVLTSPCQPIQGEGSGSKAVRMKYLPLAAPSPGGRGNRSGMGAAKL